MLSLCFSICLEEYFISRGIFKAYQPYSLYCPHRKIWIPKNPFSSISPEDEEPTGDAGAATGIAVAAVEPQEFRNEVGP